MLKDKSHSSRKRVLRALNHEMPDRVPIDFGGHRSSGIAAMGYARLKKAMGITSGDVYVYDMIQQLAIVEPEVLDAVGADAIELGRGFMLQSDDWKDWELPDGTSCKIPAFVNIERRGDDSFLISDDGIDLAIQKGRCHYFEQIHWPWADCKPDEQDFSDLDQVLANMMWSAVPSPGAHIPLTDEGCVELAEGARELRQSTDRAIIGIFGGNLFELPQMLYGMEKYLLSMAIYPDACERLSSTLCDFYLERLEKWLETVGPYIDLVLFGDDLGMQTGPLMSPEMYRRYYKPFHARMWRRTKELAPHTFTHLHCCGGYEPLLEDLIEAGLDSSNPVQITCDGMEPTSLKKNYGDRFTFWGGGCDTRSVLPRGTPDEVRRNVLELLESWVPGGGYVFQQVHNILADVPPENILAMFDAVHEFNNRPR